MKKRFVSITTLLILGGFAATASALTLGTNITIADGESGNTWSGNAGSIGAEDNEVEPGMVRNQVWDLEGFFQDGANLSMVGGFDFKDGVAGYSNYTSGDIFIDVDGDYTEANPDPAYQSGQKTIQYNFNYDFVIDLAFNTDGTTKYTVRDIRPGAGADPVYTQRVEYTQNQDGIPSSDPWRYVSGGSVLSADNDFQFVSGLGNADVDGLHGGTHYAVTGIDLSFFTPYLKDSDFVLHFTMGCGNDNLMGKGTASVPEPATLLLFGTGLAGLAGIARRRCKAA